MNTKKYDVVLKVVLLAMIVVSVGITILVLFYINGFLRLFVWNNMVMWEREEYSAMVLPWFVVAFWSASVTVLSVCRFMGEMKRLRERGVFFGVVFGLGFGIGIGVLVGLVSWAIGGNINTLEDGLIYGVAGGLASGFFLELFFLIFLEFDGWGWCISLLDRCARLLACFMKK
jgi:hypothetical protein